MPTNVPTRILPISQTQEAEKLMVFKNMTGFKYRILQLILRDTVV